MTDLYRNRQGDENLMNTLYSVAQLHLRPRTMERLFHDVVMNDDGEGKVRISKSHRNTAHRTKAHRTKPRRTKSHRNKTRRNKTRRNKTHRSNSFRKN